MFVVIICGGFGKRLWPLSVSDRPKQFINVFNDKTLLENTIDRVLDMPDAHDICIILVASILHKKNVEKVVASYNVHKVIYEPISRNTAPAIGLAVNYAIQHSSTNEPMFIFPADHYFDTSYASFLKPGLEALQKNPNGISLIGVTPTYPEIQYGYIQSNDKGGISKFIEKPELEKAEQLIKMPKIYWNTGIFIGMTHFLKDAYQTYAPQMWTTIVGDPDMKQYHEHPNISFDYAIMEKLDHNENSGFLIPFSGVWSDLGDFSRVYQLLSKDDNQNVIIGNATTHDCFQCLIHTDHPVTIHNLTKKMFISYNGQTMIRDI